MVAVRTNASLAHKIGSFGWAGLTGEARWAIWRYGTRPCVLALGRCPAPKNENRSWVTTRESAIAIWGCGRRTPLPPARRGSLRNNIAPFCTLFAWCGPFLPAAGCAARGRQPTCKPGWRPASARRSSNVLSVSALTRRVSFAIQIKRAANSPSQTRILDLRNVLTLVGLQLHGCLRVPNGRRPARLR
jgi:hypothetical protein